jgi:hypothetical protein
LDEKQACGQIITSPTSTPPSIPLVPPPANP